MNDTLIFLVLAGIALLFRWLTNAGAQRDETDSTPPDENSHRGGQAETEEERIRRFLEALGAPPGSTPPPKVQPRPAQRRVVTPKNAPESRPAKRRWGQPLPPLVTVPKEPPPLPPEFRVPIVPEVPSVPPPALVPMAAPAPLKSRTTTARPPTQAIPSRRSSLGKLLRSPASARQAILLREVLGRPRGLEPFATEMGV